MTESRWGKVGVLATVVGVFVAGISVWVAYLQLQVSYLQQQERKARLRIEVPTVDFVNRSPGQWLAVPVVVFKNEGSSAARDIVFKYQHWPLSWKGVVTPSGSFDVAPGEAKRFAISADTVADPPSTLSSGAHLYFALRTEWRNADKGTSSCDLSYIDIRTVPGAEVRGRVPLVDVLSELPTSVGKPDLSLCPKT